MKFIGSRVQSHAHNAIFAQLLIFFHLARIAEEPFSYLICVHAYVHAYSEV